MLSSVACLLLVLQSVAAQSASGCGSEIGLLIGLIVAAAIAFILLIAIIYMYRQEKKGKPMFTTLSDVKSGRV